MKEFYIEVYSPPFPNKGRKVKVYSKYPGDALSSTLIALYRVTAEDKEDALAQTLTGKAFTMLSPNALQLKFA